LGILDWGTTNTITEATITTEEVTTFPDEERGILKKRKQIQRKNRGFQ